MPDNESPQARDAHWLMNEAPELLTVSDVRAITGLGVRAVRGLADRGDLPTVRTPRRLLFSRQGLLDRLGLKRAGDSAIP